MFSSLTSCEEFEILFILFFLNLHGFSVFVQISYNGTIFLYRLSWFHLTCYYLTPSPIMLTLITILSCYHLTSDMIYLTLIIITITGMMTWHLVLVLIYSSSNRTPHTPVLLILLTCSCSFPKSDNYLINYKKGQLTSGRGKLMDINICSCL